ncbi:MAG: glycosyltransferase [Chitinophagaceae bacterium]
MSNISIITICFNNLDEVLATCRSVDEQSMPPFEHILVNGFTHPDIEKHLQTHPQPPYRRWHSGPDKGISDAFNIGIRMTKGDVIVLLNSGDCFYDQQSLETATAAFNEDPSLQWIHAKFELHRGHKNIIIGKPFEKSKAYRGMRSISHQTMFVQKSLYDRYGLYDTDMRIAMDYDFLLRIINEKFRFIEKPLVRFAPGGVSSLQYERGLEEMRSSYHRHIGKSWKLNIWQARLRFLRWLLQTRIGKWLFRLKTALKLENM